MGLLSSIGVMAGLGGDNPDRLPLININPDLVQQQTIAGNLRNAPAAFDLAALVNSFSAEELNKQLERMLPGYGALRDQVTGNISSQLRGEIPQDVERMLERRQAEIGAGRGTSGSQFDVGNLLGTLGRTSYDIIQSGLNSAKQWTAAVRVPQFDFTKMFQDPNTRWQQMFSQAQANQPIQKFNNWVDSMPSQLERGAMGVLEWGDSIIDTYTGANLGGMMGGGGSGNSGGLPSNWAQNFRTEQATGY